MLKQSRMFTLVVKSTLPSTSSVAFWMRSQVAWLAFSSSACTEASSASLPRASTALSAAATWAWPWPRVASW